MKNKLPFVRCRPGEIARRACEVFICLVVLFCSIGHVSIVNAVPAGYTPVLGDTSLSGNTLTVRENGSVVNWSDGFNLAASDVFNIFHDGGNANWAVLNRDTSGAVSVLQGQLNANMRVFVVNPSGIVVGNGAELNVPGLVLSGLDITDSNFYSGNYRFSLPAGQSSGGYVVVRGLSGSANSDIALIGNKIVVDGQVTVPGGRFSALAGDTVTVDFDGDGLMQFTIDAGLVNELLGADAGQGDAIHLSSSANIQAQSVTLHARIASAALRTAINTQGIVTAQGVAGADGEITLLGENGLALVQGDISASATGTGAQGLVDITAEDIILGATMSGDVLTLSIGGSGNGGSLTLLPSASASFVQRVIRGGAGNDSIQGFDNWVISEVNGGRASRTGMGEFLWSAVENIGGTPEQDQVVMSATGGIGNINTGAGNDVVIIAGTAQEVMTGDNDDFVLVNGAGQISLVDGGNGIDSLSGLPSATVSGRNSGTASNVSNWQNIENIQGTADVDVINVTPQGQLDGNISTGAGDDRITIAGSVDTVAAGDNNDLVTINDGTVNMMEGNNGDDIFIVQGGMVMELDGGAGFDTLSGVTDPQPLSPPVDGSGFADEVALWRSIENLIPGTVLLPTPSVSTSAVPTPTFIISELTPNQNVFDSVALSDLSLGLIGQEDPALRMPCDQWLIPPRDDALLDESCRQQEEALFDALISDLASTNIFFATDHYNISESDRERLEEVADFYRQYRAQLQVIKVHGYTDDVGTQNYNLALSNRRANAAANVLQAFGIESAEMRVVGYGETSPFVPNSSAAQRGLNRRVTVELSTGK